MTQSFYEPESAQVATLLASPSATALADLFTARVARWPHPMVQGECVTLSLFGDLHPMSSQDAFDLIPAATDWAANQSADILFIAALELLSELARISGTTQLPDTLADAWGGLADRASKMTIIATLGGTSSDSIVVGRSSNMV
ncbi:MAG: hypothetical protein AAF623_18190, partial [Planctomycetota bacterium]